jgi:hypothetical protein
MYRALEKPVRFPKKIKQPEAQSEADGLPDQTPYKDKDNRGVR